MNGKDLIYQNAPHMIVAATPRNAPCKEADPWIALSYFDLYAQSLGAGTCWCGFACYIFKWHRAMRRRLKIPKVYKIGAVILFGKPDVSYARSTCPSKPLFKE
jgi:nitroreductase